MGRGSHKMGFYSEFLLLTDVDEQDADKIFLQPPLPYFILSPHH